MAAACVLRPHSVPSWGQASFRSHQRPHRVDPSPPSVCVYCLRAQSHGVTVITPGNHLATPPPLSLSSEPWNAREHRGGLSAECVIEPGNHRHRLDQLFPAGPLTPPLHNSSTVPLSRRNSIDDSYLLLTHGELSVTGVVSRCRSSLGSSVGGEDRCPNGRRKPDTFSRIHVRHVFNSHDESCTHGVLWCRVAGITCGVLDFAKCTFGSRNGLPCTDGWPAVVHTASHACLYHPHRIAQKSVCRRIPLVLGTASILVRHRRLLHTAHAIQHLPASVCE